MQLFVHRMNQTAHISLQILSISNNVETKVTGCALTCLARPAHSTSDFCLPSPYCLPAMSVCVGPFGVPVCISAPPVRGVLRLVPKVRKCFFQEIAFFPIFPIYYVFSAS